MKFIKFFTNDKVLFSINLILLLVLNNYIILIEIHSFIDILFIALITGILSYFISICSILCFLTLVHICLKKHMNPMYHCLSFHYKIFLIANTLEVNEDNLNTMNDLIVQLHKNRPTF